MSLKLFYNIVVPLLEVMKTIVIMTSTLIRARNFFTQLLEKAEEQNLLGNFAILALRVDMICDRCKGLGDDAIKCPHNEHLRPHWKNVQKLELIRIIAEDQIETIMRESYGYLDSNENTIFDEKSLDRLIRRGFIDPDLNEKPGFVFLIVDPNAGGKSNLAMSAMVRYQGRTMVSRVLFIIVFRSPRPPPPAPAPAHHRLLHRPHASNCQSDSVVLRVSGSICPHPHRVAVP